MENSARRKNKSKLNGVQRRYFQWEARFLRFADFRKGRPRRVWVENGGRPHRLRVSKRCGRAHFFELLPQDLIRLQGEERWKKDRAEPKRKVFSLELISAPVPPPVKTEGPSFVEVCTKGNCWKQGGKKLWRAFEQALREAGSPSHVRLEESGCMGNCDRAPAVFCWPAKAFLGDLKPENVSLVLKRFFGVKPAGGRKRQAARRAAGSNNNFQRNRES